MGLTSIGLLEQMRTAKRHPTASVLGGALGGFVPIAAYTIVHQELRRSGHWDLWQPIAPVVAACLLFSVRTVWQWGHQSFREGFKASCLVVAIEGVMVFSATPLLCMVALAYLVAINAIATACTLVAEDRRPEPVTVTAVARERSLSRRDATKLVDRQLATTAKARPV